MRRQDKPVHELPSFARYLNKVFDFRAAATTLTDSRGAPEIPPASVFLAAFYGFAFRLAQLSATGGGVDPARPPAMDRRTARLPRRRAALQPFRLSSGRSGTDAGSGQPDAQAQQGAIQAACRAVSSRRSTVLRCSPVTAVVATPASNVASSAD